MKNARYEKCPPEKKPLKELESGKLKYFIQFVYIIVVVQAYDDGCIVGVPKISQW